jgi:ketosteroid isomerase-like protein
MTRRGRLFAIALCAGLIADASRAAEPAFDPQEIRAATTKLIAALENHEPTAWVYMYTEDAGLLEAGSAPLEGRAKLLALARSMQPMSSVAIVPLRIEGDGSIAFMYGRASWMNGAAPQPQSKSQVHLVIVWRKEADGQWRVAQEALVPDAE